MFELVLMYLLVFEYLYLSVYLSELECLMMYSLVLGFQYLLVFELALMY